MGNVPCMLSAETVPDMIIKDSDAAVKSDWARKYRSVVVGARDPHRREVPFRDECTMAKPATVPFKRSHPQIGKNPSQMSFGTSNVDEPHIAEPIKIRACPEQQSLPLAALDGSEILLQKTHGQRTLDKLQNQEIHAFAR